MNASSVGRGRVQPTLNTSKLQIRAAVPADREALRRLTVESFGGVNIEEGIERQLGILNGRDWRWRKARHIDADFAAHAAGIFVATSGGTVVGFITTVLDREAGRGRIPNLAVDAAMRGQGLGRRLIEHALEYFRSKGLEYAVIETLEQNEVGRHLYPDCGFLEVARQVHYARRL